MSYKLLVEEVDSHDVEVITETKNGKKHFYIKGPFMRAECVNGNKRKYPINVLSEAVKEYNTEFVMDDRAYGELDHPKDDPTVKLQRASHRIVELNRSGNDFIGKAIVMDTPSGMIAQKIMESGGKIGVSSRGMGNLKEDKEGVKVVQEGFKIMTAADMVFDPSAPGAFVSGLMEEKEWIFESGIWQEQDLERARATIKAAKKRELEHTILKEWKNLFSKI